jgi:acyl-CoA thioesterase I
MTILLRMALGGVVATASMAGWGQSVAPAAPVQAAPQVDTAKQIATMQAKLDDWAQLGRYRGQTTPQMLVRFQQDVVHLKPAVVVILAGTNDIAGNTGPSSPEMIEDNFESMAAVAKANGIRVVISSILPAAHYPWKPEAQPAEPIHAMNVRLKALAAREGLVYLDYYTSMANAQGGLEPELAADGVHPTAKGYAVMSPLAEKAIAEALARP